MIGPMAAPADADVDLVRAYAQHVITCHDCKQANTEADLCRRGGALWDQICDDDPTEPAICALCFCAGPFHRMGCANA